MMAKAGKWSRSKSFFVTFLCGLGHVGSSIVIGFAGIFLGTQLTKLEAFESFRGNMAAWFLIVFGFVYFLWGIRRALRNKPHSHLHHHPDGIVHEHSHGHSSSHAHPHVEEGKPNYTPWVLFVIFVLGPCEPLIPVLMYPAARHNLGAVLIVGSIFAAVTIATMLAVVMLSVAGIGMLHMGRFERYSHALAGAIICLSGLGIRFLGL
jgi:sulfite exporter TauE/SafE